jgi:hypothetical protein
MTTFINLTNELLRRLNEVEISLSDFVGIKNVQSLAKDAINSSIREILQDSQEWPFTLVTYEQSLTAGVGTYSFPADFSKVDWDTFYLTTTNNTSPSFLNTIKYDTYLKEVRANDEVAGAAGYTLPVNVYKTQETKFGITPVPDKAYTVEYRYWKFPADLAAAEDVCIIPNRFKHVVIDGAMMYMMQFRSNDQAYQLHSVKFAEGIKTMRRLNVDSYEYVTSTALRGTHTLKARSF